MAPANHNDPSMLNIAQYKGEVRVCEYCKPEETLLGRSCRWCFSQGYLAKCMNCNGEGKVGKPAIWDGGKSQHVSTCTPCGGTGVFPARRADYLAQGSIEPKNGSKPREMPVPVTSMKNLGITRH